MNCEHVEDLLSAYLDNVLAPEEHNLVAAHLQICPTCNEVLADFRRFDTLLSTMQRISPDASLRDRIFSSAAYLELTGTTGPAYTQKTRRTDAIAQIVDRNDRLTVPQRRVRREDANRPRLVALPGGLEATSSDLQWRQAPGDPILPPKRRIALGQRIMQIMIAACLLLTVGVGSFIGWSLWQGQEQMARNVGGITPPQGPRVGGPIPAGMRFIFLRNGTLWSGSADENARSVRLTPTSVMVATSWEVRPPLLGRAAGDILAYVDLQQGYIHEIRSDGQSDTSIKQPLIKMGVQPSSVWDTSVGSAILNGLSWSQDGSMLAFVAAPTGTPGLYIYSMSTGEVHVVSLPGKGAAFHPVWSPDGTRIAFEFAHDGIKSILDYNTQNHGVLTIASVINTKQNPTDTVLTLDWSSNADLPAVTWSTGTPGHVHGIWTRRVGVSEINGADSVRTLATGDYIQATYSRAGRSGTGSWLLTPSLAGHAGDILDVDLASTVYRLTSGKQAEFAQWSSDGIHIGYFDALSSGVGSFRIIDTTTGVDTLVASSVVSSPTPAWSVDGQQVLYSTGMHVFVNTLHGAKTQLKMQGSVSAFVWSRASPRQAIIAMRDEKQGVYQVDSQKNTTLPLSTEAVIGPIQWTQIP